MLLVAFLFSCQVDARAQPRAGAVKKDPATAVASGQNLALPVPPAVLAPGGGTSDGPGRGSALFGRIALPEAWKAEFWAGQTARSLFALEPKAIADMVPVQAGMRFCRCPSCDADELDDPLEWSPEKPAALRCRRCGVTVPNDKFPAKEKDKPVPEEAVEVLPGTIHHYPYHAVEPTKCRIPDERLYLQAKRDYQARLYLTKAALYAAVKYREQPKGSRDPKLALASALIILRFAQVYPAYATHLDQPGEPKHFQPANLAPPYRSGYRTGKWEWNGSLDVPMNLLLAYALIGDDPAMVAAGKLLGDPRPRRTIARDLFHASAEFARRQPEEYTEDSLHVYRGMLAVGKLIGDADLVRDATERLDGFGQRGFYYDGMWRQASLRSHRRVLGVLDGWIDRLLEDASKPEGYRGDHFKVARPREAAVLRGVPILGLARDAGSVVLSRMDGNEIKQASWPAPLPADGLRRPRLLGGAGIARLAIGAGADALDLELRGLDSFAEPHFQRLALRLSVAGLPVLDDLDEQVPTSSGWDLATPSHNTVVVDGLNQRENPTRAGKPVAGSDVLFYATDPDFQVTSFRDPRAYPTSTTRYRHTLIASAAARSRYAISLFEVQGGLQHDQFFHAAPGSVERWASTVATHRAESTLLIPSVTFLKGARADQGRWFVQSYGFFHPHEEGVISRPGQVWLARTQHHPSADATLAPRTFRPERGEPRRLKLHILGDVPVTMITATSPDPSSSGKSAAPESEEPSRPSLILRRRSEDGATLKSTFVTLMEPVGDAFPPIVKVGRVASTGETVVIYVETAEGPEQIVVNFVPGTIQKLKLIDGQDFSTDGFVVRVRKDGLVLAGGTFATGLGHQVRQSRITGTITKTGRKDTAKGLGWFETRDVVSPTGPVEGRILHVTHGDGSTHAWTLRAIETTENRTRFHVQEEPGFTIDPATNVAGYYQFPGQNAPGPHQFRISTLAR